MKKTVLCIALIVFILMSLITLSACDKIIVVDADAELNVGQIKIMSMNLRSSNLFDKGELAWNYRKKLVAQNIQQAKPTIIGMQEVKPEQYRYCKKILQNYDSKIVYRDNTNNSEGCPIFYYKDLYTLIDKGTFWLSETPESMSKSWDSAYYRICSYVVLRDNNTNKEFAVFNTHLDNESETARVNGMNVILNKIHSIGDYPTIIMGDFNATEKSQTYLNATETLLDVKYQVENEFRNCATYHNWGQELDRTAIDYFMITKTDFTVDSYEVITTTYDGNYASDHFPIVTTLTLAD